MKKRRLILLGSTGSIGMNTLVVVDHLRRIGAVDFEVVGLAAGTNDAQLAEQARHHGTSHVALADETNARQLSEFRSVFTGPDAAMRLVETAARPGDLVVGAMVGSAGIPAILKAVELGCDIALANKETLVAAGELVMPLVRAKGVNLIPIDSEHSAIFQCLLAGRSIDEVKQLVITASGGPFRSRSADAIEHATVDEALDHPTWTMGPKVTIDSATLMNKALEVIEAHWLFGLPGEKIKAIIHPQSLIHSFVEFVDGSVIAQLGPPDMQTPIQYALTWPDRAEGCSRIMDWENLRRMDFQPVDPDRFGALKLAHTVIESGGTAGAVFNAANEVAVQAFLDHRITFGRITRLVAETLDHVTVRPVSGMDCILEADRAARAHAWSQIKVDSGSSAVNPSASPVAK